MGEKEENQSYKVANVTLIFQTESKVDSGNYMPGNLPFSITSQQINSQQHSRLITEQTVEALGKECDNHS